MVCYSVSLERDATVLSAESQKSQRQGKGQLPRSVSCVPGPKSGRTDSREGLTFTSAASGAHSARLVVFLRLMLYVR